MISCGLSAANQAKFHALLGQNHHIAISLSLMDLNHQRLATLTDQFLAGQVVIDEASDVTRSASLVFLDPDHKMALDSNSPADAAMYIDRMICITYTVYSPDKSFWVTVPVFTGPITKMDRDWAIVRIECMGKEILALDNFWAAKTWRKGAFRNDVIRSMLSGVGEAKFSLPSNTSRLTRDLAVSSEHKPWSVARQVARTGNYQLFYDGRGICVMRPFPSVPVWTFTDRAGGTILSKPEIGYDSSAMFNAVQIKGAIPKGMKKPVTWREVAPPGSPLYPYAIGRGGKPRFIPVYIDDDSIDTVAEAKAVAKARLNLGSYESVTAAFDILPVPHLEPRDVYRISTAEVATTTIVTQMTIPLAANDPASIGYLRSLKPRTANIRRRK